MGKMTFGAGERAPLPLPLDPGPALIVVDVQHDFLPGGALAVPGGDRVIAPIAALAASHRGPVVFSRDAHPAGHCSFAAQGGAWPEHCVQGTRGAEIHPDLASFAADVVAKATSQDADAYSAFDGTGLAGRLRAMNVTRVLVCGLATDYCVKATALDSAREGFATAVITDAVAAVNANPGDGSRALAEIQAAGVAMISSSEAAKAA